MLDNIEQTIECISRAVKGKRTAAEMALTCLIAQGHMLIEDIPGVGKTTMVKALARSLGLGFNRIQFTPDVLPSDVTGVDIYNQTEKKFVYMKGPVFTNILLADEINRATPKTQSSLLEVMEERQVTVDGAVYKLPYPFMVMATQNPIDFEGTFVLPESQLDRFMMKISMGYPQRSSEKEMLDDYLEGNPLDEIVPVLSADEVKNMIEDAKDVFMAPEIKEYILDIGEATRTCEYVSYGVSPRGLLLLARAAKAFAYMEGRDYCIPDDVKKLAPYVLPHRIIIKSVKFNRGDAKSITDEIIRGVRVPRGEAYV